MNLLESVYLIRVGESPFNLIFQFDRNLHKFLINFSFANVFFVCPGKDSLNHTTTILKVYEEDIY